MRIIPDKIYKTMWRVQWEDGSLSADFYNKTRALEYIRYPEVIYLTLGQTHNASYSHLEAR